ncbi:MAG TPA: response regulator [Thermoanaerobaculia bacterium]|jgi:signal transduction histidine kinase|nr:response regulator [Thermoanaerobaculia bacterium]
MADSLKGSVLILEDDGGIALLERRALERVGYTASIASTAEEALDRLGRERFDLVLLDYQLAGPVSGLDVYQRLRDRWPDLPAILVTGFSDQGKVIEALRAGVRDVVPKVGDYLEYLPHAADRVLKAVQAERRLAESEAMLREANEALERRVAERTAELQHTKELAEAANRAKDHFLAVLSHELRTPLAPVLTTVQLLEHKENLPDDMREALAMIRRNVELEARLIDDLLDLTGITRGKLDLTFETVDVHQALREVLEICDRDLHAKRIAVTAELNARRVYVRADPARLQQVLWNVVKNAVKFTPEEGRILLRTGDGPAGTIEIEVTDSGVGIDAEVLPRIFDAFEQGGRDVTRMFGGLGLGLAISKTLMDLHGGSLRAESDGRGSGATFFVSLAAETSRPAELSRSPRASEPGGREPLRIFLVEDHADTREALAGLLEIYGHQVRSAGSVAAALAALGDWPFDLVISDIGLPDGSGLDLMRELAVRHPGGVRAICMTGFGMEEDIRKSREAGFLAHLTKPVNLQELETVLSRVMREPCYAPSQ